MRKVKLRYLACTCVTISVKSADATPLFLSLWPHTNSSLSSKTCAFFAGIQSLSKALRNRNIEYAIAVNHMGDQKRRLNIGIGLLNNPNFLFFDEPTIGIAPNRGTILWRPSTALKKRGRLYCTAHTIRKRSKKSVMKSPSSTVAR
jgi:hypothetical protein